MRLLGPTTKLSEKLSCFRRVVFRCGKVLAVMCGQCHTLRAFKHVRPLRFFMAAGTSKTSLKALHDLTCMHSNKLGAVCTFVASTACCAVSERRL